MKHLATDRPVRTRPYPDWFTPAHRSNVPVDTAPRTRCHHHWFMRCCRNTEVPVCTRTRTPGSLYCAAHQIHPV